MGKDCSLLKTTISQSTMINTERNQGHFSIVSIIISDINIYYIVQINRSDKDKFHRIVALGMIVFGLGL